MFYVFMFGGSGLFGRTDKVGNLLYVGTNFIHLFFIPLIPLGSYVVRREHDEWDGFKGVRIRLSIKSILYAWARTAAIITIPVMLYRFYDASYGVGAIGRDPMYSSSWDYGPGWTGVLYIAGSLLALWLMRVTSVASNRRGIELAQMAGFQIERVQGTAQSA